MAALALIAALQLAFASEIVETVWPEIVADLDTWAVPQFRQVLAVSHLKVGLVLLGYWLFVATMGSGKLLAIRSADLFLALSGLSFASSMAVHSLVYRPAEILERLCPGLGLSNEAPKFGLDHAPTRCEEFAGATLLVLYFGIPTLLLLISAFIRVLISHKRTPRYRSTGT